MRRLARRMIFLAVAGALLLPAIGAGPTSTKASAKFNDCFTCETQYQWCLDNGGDSTFCGDELCACYNATHGICPLC